MKASDLIIKKVFLCSLDARAEYVSYNEFVPGSDDEITRYIKKLVLYNRSSMVAKPSSYREDSYLAQILPEEEESMESFVNLISEELLGCMKENQSILPGSGLFVWVLMEEQNYLGFFKLEYQSRLMNEIYENGQIAWTLNTSLLPVTSQKAYEFFLINMDMQRVWVSDKKYTLGMEEPVNLLAEELLKVKLDKSEKELLETIDDVVTETIFECCPGDAQKKIFEYKNVMAENVQEDGRIRMGEVSESIFSDNAEAESLLKERLAQNRVPQIPVLVGKKVEQKLKKKHKIVTSDGIEIQIPPALLQDEACFSYHTDEQGNVIITITDHSGSLKLENMGLEQTDDSEQTGNQTEAAGQNQNDDPGVPWEM